MDTGFYCINLNNVTVSVGLFYCKMGGDLGMSIWDAKKCALENPELTMVDSDGKIWYSNKQSNN